ncbi:l-2-amino-thiazoline-4-carboxylic acid hydrolase domain-containing protein [Pochonia chlamydosporia 170]|uniref:L-2-amino-thiazoline-4-carboxylic acid hydrolase domain-containing protein n=1 Tax=Pochonia chlamydosporia 170 TaxID=1380566 RepID=A0A179FKR3_METCM|nr:l-2-amino-thiazoline-4-carboxylic acid hydrolase domain-containing protein [Pochonia chlamydosporia 170]OAQ65938.1 l-2-amino-thiazoline-4-carboxylic acid hydrolase domain-containing protein [Pochonia chlamydosporia 170]
MEFAVPIRRALLNGLRSSTRRAPQPGAIGNHHRLFRRSFAGTANSYHASASASKEGSSQEKPFNFEEYFLDSVAAACDETAAFHLSPRQRDGMSKEARGLITQLSTASDPPGRVENIQFTAYMVAPYRILKQEGLPVSQIREILEVATKTSASFVSDAIRQQLDSSPDPFKHLTDVSRGKEATLYAPPDFKLKHPIDTKDIYHVEIHQCWYMKALKKLDATEIGSTFCAFDRTWYDQIDPSRHRVRFARPTTIADGSDRCRFNFDRVPREEEGRERKAAELHEREGST